MGKLADRYAQKQNVLPKNQSLPQGASFGEVSTNQKTELTRPLNVRYDTQKAFNLDENGMKKTSISASKPSNSIEIQELNYEEYNQLQNEFEKLTKEYGKDSFITKAVENQLKASFVPKDKEFSVKKDIINPTATGIAKGLTFGLLEPTLSADTETSDTGLAKGVETVANLGTSFATSAGIYGVANKVLGGLSAFQAINNPFIRNIVTGQVADLVIQSPLVIGKSMSDGKKPDEILKDWVKDQAVNLAFNSIFSGFENLPQIKKLFSSKEAGQITQEQLEQGIKDEADKLSKEALSQTENIKQSDTSIEATTKPTINETAQSGVITPTAENTINQPLNTSKRNQEFTIEANKENAVKADLNAPIVTDKQINLFNSTAKKKFGENSAEKVKEITDKYGVNSVEELSQKQMNEALYKEFGYGEKVNDVLDIPQDDTLKVLAGNKVHLLDYMRTPQKVLEKIGLGKQARQLIDANNNYLDELPKEIDKVTAWYDRVKQDPTASQRIFQYLDKPKNSAVEMVVLNTEEKKVADEIKSYLSDWADKLGLPKSRRLTNYITHIFEQDFLKKDFDPDIAKLITNKVPGSVYDPFVAERLGKQGYVEDVFRSLDAYIKRGVRKANFDPALNSLSEASKDLPLENWQYVKKLGDRINMRPTDTDTLIDNLIKATPIGYKFGARPFTSLTKNARNLVYKGTLGLNVGSAIRNLTQGVNTYAKLGEKWTAKGYIDNFKSMVNGSDELEKVGVLRDSFIQDRKLSSTKKAMEKLDKGLFSLFELAEKVNRGGAYYGAKARALSQGLSEEEAIKKGVEMARQTQFTFGSVDTPVALQSDIMKTLGQFQSFNVKQAEFLGEMAKNKEWGGLIRFIGANALIIGTVGQMLGYDYKDMIPFSGVVTGDTKLGQTPPIQAVGDVVNAVVNPPDKFGNVNKKNIGERLLDVVSKDAPAFIPAGVQTKKTFQGIDAVNKGASYNQNVNVQYAIDQTPGNYVRGALFGKSNLDEAQTYFDENKNAFGENQTAAFKYAQKNGIKNTDFYKAVDGLRNLKTEVEGRKEPTTAEKRRYLATLFKGEKLILMVNLLVDTDKGKKIMEAGAK